MFYVNTQCIGGYSDLKCSCLRALSVLSSDVALRTKLTVFEQALVSGLLAVSYVIA